MTAVLLARVAALRGPPGVARVLELAESERSAQYLSDIVNWISYDEAIALLRAGGRVTHEPHFARRVGEDAARRLNGSPVAALFRSLGSPENVYRQIATSSSKYSVVTRLEVVDQGPGFAEITAVAVDGFARDPDHCEWTCGLLTQPTILFGLPPAIVEHDECAALGAPQCRYRVSWAPEPTEPRSESERNRALLDQIAAMKERLESIFATAADLIGADGLTEVLAKITDRAAVEIRAPRYLLAIRTAPGAEPHCHHRGFAEHEVAGYAEKILRMSETALPVSWLVAPVRSSRRDYGRLLVLADEDRRFFDEERELLDVYARYAASALDSATALADAERRYGQSSALLDLARALASAGTSGEIAQRLAAAVPAVVDCDRVGVYLWDPDAGELVRRALAGALADGSGEWRRAPAPGGPLERLLREPGSEPIFIDDESGDPILRELSAGINAVASILVPLATPDQLLGLVAVSVMERPHRLKLTPDLRDRLSGMTAQATTALENGRLIDQITHQARHDGLTGLANRGHLTDRLSADIVRARRERGRCVLLYLDLDEFKPVNDELGHDAGDELLISVAQRLSRCVRATDTVARLGGDEFAILLSEATSEREAEMIGLRVADAFATPFRISGHARRIGVSIGRATYPGDGDTADRLLRAADQAMFQIKRSRTPVSPVR